MPKLKPGMHLHLVGIGGTGVSAIARVLLGRGYVVSGSDQQRNELTMGLESAGAIVHLGHRPENIGAADALVISSAIQPSNPEVIAAKEIGIPVLKRADLLGFLMDDSTGIAVAGSHGKTTTTAMIAQILMEAGLDPTVIVGGVLPFLGANGRHGEGEYFVVEADEYDYMFLGLRPELIVITNIEHDHPDIFPTEADYASAFRDFVAKLPVGGRLIACVDDPGVLQLLADLNVNVDGDGANLEVITYRLANNGHEGATVADYMALDARPNQLGGTDFLVEGPVQPVRLARLRVPGLHNVRNALAAIIVALQCGIEFSVIGPALASFGGVGRRFEVVGEASGVTIIDDYAHHPTEIRVTLAAARQRYPGRRLWAVWQPHTFSRARLLLEEFAASFHDADRVITLDIFGSREQVTAKRDGSHLNTEDLVEAMDHPNAVYAPGIEAAADYISERLRPDDIVLTLSAGDGFKVGHKVLHDLTIRMSTDLQARPSEKGPRAHQGGKESTSP
jgi:UDP-N-acetylmuramate--alanine ligase